MNYFLLIIPFSFITLGIWVIVTKRKQVVKDWDTLDYLKKRANEVSTKY